MSSVPKTAKFIGRYNVNANLGTRSKMYRKTLVPWGINNHNMKGIILLGFFSQNQMKIVNIFFKKPSYVTWRSFNKMRSSHMLDVISISENFFKCVESCEISKKGMICDHCDVRLDFMIRSIKYKTTFIKKTVIDWKANKEKDDVNKKCNVNLRNCLQEPFNSTEFNGTILCSGEDTSMIDNTENQGWLKFSRDTLTPTLQAQNSVLHYIRSNDNTPPPRTLFHLKILQHKVDEAVDIAKKR